MADTARMWFLADASSVVRAAREGGAATKAFATEAEAQSARASESFRRIGKSAIASTAGIIGVGAAYEGIKHSATTVEELAKQTLALNHVTGLTLETSSAYAAVAQAQGLSARQLNQAFGTLSKNAQAVVNAHDGLTKSAKTQENAFRALGIPVSQVIKVHGDLNKLLPQVTAAFERMPGGITKTAAGMALFGRGWQTLVPLMHEGTLGLKEQLDMAQKMGATIDGHSIKSLKDLAKAQEESKYASLGASLAFGQYLAPALTKAEVAFGKFTHAVGEGIHWLDEHKAAAKALAIMLGTTLGGALTLLTVDKYRQFKKWATDVIGGFGGVAGAAGESAAGQATAEGEMVASVAAAEKKIIASNTAIAGSFQAAAASAATGAAEIDAAEALAATGAAGGAAASGSLLGKLLSKFGGAAGLAKIGGTALAGYLGITLEEELTGSHARELLGGGQPNEQGREGEAFFKQHGFRGEHLGPHGEGERGKSNQYPFIYEIAKRFGIDPKVLWGVYGKETAYGANISTSSAGAMGPFQFIPETAKAYGYPETNTPNAKQFRAQAEAAARYLKGLLRRTHGDVAQALSDYSGGGYSTITGGAAGRTLLGAGRHAVETGRDTSNLLSQVTRWAEKSVGHFAESWGKNTGPELDKLQEEFKTHAAAWCAEFATTAAMMGGANKAVRTASVATIREWAEQGSHGYKKGVTSTPTVGALMLFGNQHVGFVQSVNKQAGTVSTIEGNTSGGKVERETHSIFGGEFATPLYHKAAAGLGQLAKGFADAAKQAEHLHLSMLQIAQVGVASIFTADARSRKERFAGVVSGLGEAWQQARPLQELRRQPLTTATGAREQGQIVGQDKLTAEWQKRYEQKELAELQKEVTGWKKLRDMYRRFARHAHGNAKPEAIKKAAEYQGKIAEAEQQAKALHGSIVAAETTIEEAKQAEQQLPSEALAAQNAHLDLEAKAGVITPAQAKAAKEANLRTAINNGTLTGDARLEAIAQLKELGEAAEDATSALQQHTQALEESAKALREFAQIATSAGAIESASLLRSLADIISGQLGGVNMAGRQLTPGAGSPARY